jgi:hypothetical protein
MTVADCVRALEAAPGVQQAVLIGGEPTLHPDLMGIVAELRSCFPSVALRIYSNAHTADARELLRTLEKLGIYNNGRTMKLEGSVRHGNPHLFVAPRDIGIERDPCKWASGHHGGTCGFSADAGGLTGCAIGGMIDGILGLGMRSWKWAEFSDRKRLLTLCQHCGAFPEFRVPGGLGEFRGQVMSKSWLAAVIRS